MKDYTGPEESTDRDLPEFLATRLFVARKKHPPPLLVWPLVAAGLLGLFGLAHLLLNHSPLTRALERAARRAVEERLVGSQLTGHLSVGWFGTLSLSGLRLPGPTPDDPPTLVAERIVVHPSLWALLTGHLRPRSLELRWVRLQTGPKGAWLRSLAQRLSQHRGAPEDGKPARGAKQAPPEVIVRDLFVDLPQRDPTAAPTSIGPLDVTAQWGREGTALTFDLRGSLMDGKGGHFSAAGAVSAGEVSFQGGLSALSLSALPPGLFAHGTMEVNEGAFSGDVSGTLHGKKLDAQGGFALAQANVAWQRLAADPVGPFNFGLRGQIALDLDEHTFAGHQLILSVNKAQAILDVSLDKKKSFELEVRLADVDMQAAIDSLPAQLRPPPQAPRVQGPLSADFDLRGVLGDWAALEIRRADLDLSGLKDAAERNEISNFLKAPFEFTPGGQEAPARSFEVGPGNGRFAAIASLPSYVVRAVVISEDAGFYGHHGFDFDEIKESISRDLSKGQAVRGGSSLTQQLVKNLFLSREKKLSRKIQEALITVEIEAALPKWRILEIYLNTIEWGPRLYGIGEAAERYFGERPQELSPKQAAFLASIIPNPKKYYWYFARGALTSNWEEKVNRLLDKMATVGAIDPAQRAAANPPLSFHRSGAPAAAALPSADSQPTDHDEPL